MLSTTIKGFLQHLGRGGRRELSSLGSVDVHTHMYLPGYMQMMRERTDVPKILNIGGEDRLLVLPNEAKEITTSSGRPIGREYWDVHAKLDFMDKHDIDVSVLSLANPWLDFLNEPIASEMARAFNDEMETICQDHPGKFLGLASLPLNSTDASLAELDRISNKSTHPHIRGVIMGCLGSGEGLDHPDMLPIWTRLQELNYITFIHPHYGIGNEHFGNYGHSLFLALGFPFETTTAIARLILSGVFDKLPDLKLLLAHSGGTLPFLAGRLDSCYHHDEAIRDTLEHDPSHYLSKLYLDAVNYQTPALVNSIEVNNVKNLMFGTDNPFFPPKEGALSDEPWTSVTKNYEAIEGLGDKQLIEDIKRNNALRAFGEIEG
jgi:predicted TIM-barrel fold metal-dependent hydrolase